MQLPGRRPHTHTLDGRTALLLPKADTAIRLRRRYHVYVRRLCVRPNPSFLFRQTTHAGPEPPVCPYIGGATTSTMM
jgi:hypothetical protein